MPETCVPAGFLRNPEDIGGRIFVTVFGIGVFGLFDGLQLLVFGLERSSKRILPTKENLSFRDQLLSDPFLGQSEMLPLEDRYDILDLGALYKVVGDEKP